MADLITRTDIQATCGLSQNVEDRKLTPWILQAHRRLEKILGRTGYALLQSETLAAEPWASMTTHLKEYLCWTAYELAWPGFVVEVDRAGVFRAKSDKADKATVDEFGMTLNSVRSSREVAQERLLLHLEENAAGFDWYGEQDGMEERITDTNRAGIVFRKGSKQTPYRG